MLALLDRAFQCLCSAFVFVSCLIGVAPTISLLYFGYSHLTWLRNATLSSTEGAEPPDFSAFLRHGTGRLPFLLQWWFFSTGASTLYLCCLYLLGSRRDILRCLDRVVYWVCTRRVVQCIMGYDPADPATWNITQLRHYAAEHHIDIPSGCEKSELVALVDECLTDELLAEHIRKENVVDTAVLPDIAHTSADKILHHVAYASYAKVLRRHPAKLQEIIDAGLRQLQSLSFVARFCSAQLHCPLEAWLGIVALGEDSGASLRAALTPPEGAAPASSVCGRLCGDNEMVVRCLDCGADPTCVMCMDCFRHSPCVNHRYRITQSSGGGMCDCGDPTAWKPESFCSKHRAAAVRNATAAANGESGSLAALVNSLAEEDREWVVILLRGIVQFIAVTLLQHLRIGEVQKKAKANGSKKRRGAGAAAPQQQQQQQQPASEEARLVDDVARIPDTFDWLSSWLNMVTKELWELIAKSDVAKQIVSQLWAEPLHLESCTASQSAPHSVTPAHENEEREEASRAHGSSPANTTKDAILAALPAVVTCVQPVFMYEASRPVTVHELPSKRASSGAWREAVGKCLSHCLSDPQLRFPVGGLMAAYAECINALDHTDDNANTLYKYQVQVLTNPDVIRYLMTPDHLPYRNATNTVLHRALSSVFYTLALAVDNGPRNPVTRTSSVATDGLIFTEHQYEHLSLAAVTAFHYCLNGSPSAGFTLVVNRLAWRAFAQLAGTLAISGFISADPDAPSAGTRYPTPDFYGRVLARHTWLWFHAIRAVMAALLRLSFPDTVAEDPATPMPPLSPVAVTEALSLPPELWTTWAEATQFDAPPDLSRRRLELMQMLKSCRVSGGRDEALLLLQSGPLAAAQAAAFRQALQHSHRGEEGAERETAAPAAAADPALTTAVGYAVQVLYELSRTMDTVFQKQRDGFCRRCHAIALEREGRPSAADVLPEPETPVADTHQQEPQPDEDEQASAQDSARDEEEPRHPVIPPSPTLSPSQPPIDVLEYNLLEPSIHATTFSNHLPQLFGTVLTAWVIEQQRCVAGSASASLRRQSSIGASCRLSGLSEDASSPSPSSGAHLARPLRTLLDCFFRFRAAVVAHPAHDRLTFCQQLLDSLVMPQVLLGQVQDGLWRRDNYGVSIAANMYVGFSRSVAAEFDILMLQVLSVELAPADMAIHMLRRFTYAPPRARDRKRAEQAPRRSSRPSLSFRKYLNGYKHYLHLMLTLVTDVSKAAFHPPLSALCIDRTVAHYLAHNKASHSSIISSVSDSVRGGDFGDAEEDERDASGNVIKYTQVIDAAIKKLAVAQDSPKGKQFRLRNPQTWKTHVSLYHSSVLDGQLEDIYNNYRSIVLIDNAELQKTAAEPDVAAAPGGNTSAKPRIALPPTELTDTAMHPELLPTTRALLHTDAFLLPALYVLHQFVGAHAAKPADPKADETATGATATTAAASPPPPASAEVSPESADIEARYDYDVGVGGEAGGSRESTATGDEESNASSDDDDEDANLITREALLHATTALYLCVQDCRSITRAMQAAAATSDAPPAASPTTADVTPISWDLVEAYLQRFRVNELSFTSASCTPLLPLPELVRPRTLLHKLQTRVTVHVSAAHAAKTTLTSADMLHQLRSYLQCNKDSDPYSCLEMVEAVLVETGLATFETAAASAEQQAKEEAAQSRKKLIQERQAKLMQRMRSRALKTPGGKTAAVNAAADEEAPLEIGETEPLTGTNPLSPNSATLKGTPSGASGGSLLTKLLLELATVDCCVCRSVTDEPLFLLCHSGTSSALLHLGAITLPDNRGVHNHLCICGHAAHKSCVEKLFVRLSVLWQRWNFRSQNYLGPTEFNCPVCNTIITTLAPVPSLAAGAVSPASPNSGPSLATLFEELQAGTVHADSDDANDRTADVVTEFHTNLANGAVGFSPSEDIPALVATEDALQRDNDAAWIMSEAIRTVFYSSHLLLEGVKAGQAISHRDLISLLSLLVSVAPAQLRAEQAALRSNYSRSAADQDSLLLLDALLQPREAAHLIRAYLLSHVFPSMPADYVIRLLACWGRSASHTPAGAEEDAATESATARCAAAAEAVEADFPGITMAAWKAIGVLSLLKALAVEDASHSIILSSGSFTVNGTVEFTTLGVPSVQSPLARCTAVVRMLQYLLPVAHKGATEELHLVAQEVLQCISAAPASTLHAQIVALQPSPLPYTTASEYVQLIAEKVLHMPRVYATILTAFAEFQQSSASYRDSGNMVMCCYCGKHLCMKARNASPEVYPHLRGCGGAVGLFLSVRYGSYYVFELTSGRLYVIPSNYTDEYGERDRNLRRGVPLFRDPEETEKLVLLWLHNRWGAVSSVFAASNRMDLTEW